MQTEYHFSLSKLVAVGLVKCVKPECEEERPKIVNWNCMYCMLVYDTPDNWIIKANFTKACAPPPAERRCQRSVTSSIYVHWSRYRGRASSSKPSTISCYVLVSPAGNWAIISVFLFTSVHISSLFTNYCHTCKQKLVHSTYLEPNLGFYGKGGLYVFSSTL